MKKHGIKLHPNYYKANLEGLDFDKNNRLQPWFKGLPKMELKEVYATVGMTILQTIGAGCSRYFIESSPQVIYLSDQERAVLQPSIEKQLRRIYRKSTK